MGGAAVATAAVFALPVLAAIGAASAVNRLSQTWWLPAFGRYAGAGAIGLLVVTLTSLARPVADINPGLLVGSLFVGLAARRVHPLLLLAGAITAGAITASLLN